MQNTLNSFRVFNLWVRHTKSVFNGSATMNGGGGYTFGTQ